MFCNGALADGNSTHYIDIENKNNDNNKTIGIYKIIIGYCGRHLRRVL